jgi:hypothetical protein
MVRIQWSQVNADFFGSGSETMNFTKKEQLTPSGSHPRGRNNMKRLNFQKS